MMNKIAIKHPYTQGFTLVEMLMVIVITGVIGSMVAIFLRAPVQQFTDVARRADISDIAETASHRMVRDVRLALSNSVRRSGVCDGVNPCYLEFIPTRAGGRYRRFADPTVANSAVANAAILDTTTVDTQFEVLGSAAPVLVAGDNLVIYNLNSNDAYQPVVAVSGVRVDTPTSAGNMINFPAHQFSYDSPQGRFSVVTAPVTYACVPNATTPSAGTLTRYTGYGFSTVPLTPPATGSANLLAKNVSFCKFTYNPAVVAQRWGLVTIDLAITESGETVKLYTTAQVSNQP